MRIITFLLLLSMTALANNDLLLMELQELSKKLHTEEMTPEQNKSVENKMSVISEIPPKYKAKLKNAFTPVNNNHEHCQAIQAMGSLVKTLEFFGVKELLPKDFENIKKQNLRMLVLTTWISKKI